MSEQLHVKKLTNGLTLLGQPMENVSSAAMVFMLPCGAAQDPSGVEGAAAVAGEWLFRGAGGRDTRALNDAFDALGCQHHEGAQGEHIQLSAGLLGRNLSDAMALYADVLLRPSLEDKTFGPCRDLTLQDLASLEDEPARKCTMVLQEKFYPYPLGRCVYGSSQSLQGMSAQTVRDHARGRLTPHDVIVSAAGRFEWPSLCEMVEQHFGDWSALQRGRGELRPAAGGVTHVQKDSAQTHIGLAHASIPIRHERYYAARMAETVLSGGMSSRLFNEVREKRGLVYHVSCRYHSLKDHAGMFTYAGTVPEKAQETFDVTVGEIRRLAEGICDDEMVRARTQLKSSLIMQGESTTARAGALAHDWYHLRRLRGLREISDAIDGVTAGQVMDYLHENPAGTFTVLVIGPEPVDAAAAEG